MKRYDIKALLAEEWYRAEYALDKGNNMDALAHLKVVLKYDRRSAPAYNRLGLVYANERKFRKSLRAFKRAIKYLNDPSPAMFDNLALAYSEINSYRKALRNFEIALELEPNVAVRHIAIADILEHLGRYEDAKKHLGHAVSLENNNETRRRYLRALRKYKAGKGLNEELLDALEYNKVPWEYIAVESYQAILEGITTLCDALQEMIDILRKKKLSITSRHTLDLCTIFLHNTRACVLLLERNYSHAASSLARSLYEIYLKASYSNIQRGYRGYAEMAKKTLNNQLGANKRILKPGGIIVNRKRATEFNNENNQIMKELRNLDRRYRHLTDAPSTMQMAIRLDGNSIGAHYDDYAYFYQTGSASSHSDRKSIVRAVRLSGTSHAGLFVDSLASVEKCCSS